MSWSVHQIEVGMMKVFARGIAFDGKHGVYEEERRDGRHFEVDVEVTLRDASSAESDALAETLDYRHLAEIVVEVAQGPSRFLVEKLAGEVVRLVLERHGQVEEVCVEVRKIAPDVAGSPEWVGARLTRRRSA
ncbi:dihydroneopterin aldolase [Bradymonadaceae bacterium TMQ3]|uniref:7,8-dihydroneopterin aldolase n=1 Tax=Lujinxingia sediminis TaxID=2480984 RepID=A0ABY0CS43_9DELT|nr:dihydroneopterin aldolase [Lujinxingia sediminis]RDV37678.1 dihydroneopterin aldolase [Bradymonadaceae bacterium TMQ3]RVU43081.1 dihydroneopterin aldolase [Lujinxingia sediminis]TXC75538.1 dihydroneopterin aldolase [Bradymonadales bacterium TMQ1]